MGALKLRISVVTTLINVSKFADLPVCGGHPDDALKGSI